MLVGGEIMDNVTDNKENNQGDNVLFIGNGFDLHNGLNTRYTDYLDSLDQEIVSKVILRTLGNGMNRIQFYFYNDKDRLDQVNTQFIYTSNIHQIADTLPSLNKADIENIKKYGINMYISDNGKVEYSFNNVIQKLKHKDCECLILNCIQTMALANDTEKKQNYYTFYAPNGEYVSLDVKTKSIIELYIDKYKKVKNSKEILIDIPTLEYELEDKIQPNNFFEIYLELIRSKIINYDNDIIELNAGQNWIDVENILYENQFSHFRSMLRRCNDQLSIYDSLEKTNELKYQEFIKIFDNDRTVLEDFNNFKQKFANYVEKEQKKININEVTKFYRNLVKKYEISRVYNFNYSNYLNDIIDTNNKTSHKTTTIQNIHGDVINGKDIVFGTNHYMFLEDLKQHNKYLENTNLTQYLTNEEQEFKLTKMFQVMKIVGDKPQHSFNKVNSLTLLGHSIGGQDYEYIHSIIRTNPSNIKLNIIWTNWVDDNGQPRDNLEELTSGLYKMLGKYEQLHDDLSLHKMLLENRISFINIDDIDCNKKIEEEQKLNEVEVFDM